MNTLLLIGIAVGAIALLLFLVMKVKLPAFIALLLVAVLTAAAAGIPIAEIMPLVISGMGSTLGSVALLVGLGAMLGAIFEKTGGAEVLAERFTEKLGAERVGPALLLASAIIAVPIFFDVAFIILVPIMFSFAKAAGHKSPVYVGAPIAALMVFIHNLVPPHPGVTGSSTLLGADIGLVTLLGLALAVPMGFLAYYVGKLVTRKPFDIDPAVQRRFDESGTAGTAGSTNTTGPGTSSTAPAGSGTATAVAPTTVGTSEAPSAHRRPGPFAVIAMIVLPILMISIGTVGGLLLEEGTTGANVVSFIGQPGFALLVAVLVALLVLGVRNGWGHAQMGEMMDAALAPAAIVVFVTGAGGVFARVLTESGIGATISDYFLSLGVPILFLAFLLATVFKVAQGSGTVATLGAAGLVQATVEAGAYSPLQIAIIVLAIGCGSVALSHINDSGFWIASRFLGLSVAGGLRTWTVMATVLGWSSFLILCLLWVLVS